MQKGFTLLEILVIILIIGITASLGVVNYGKVKEGALNKEAEASLRLIQAAEKIYHMKRIEGTMGYYATGSNTTQINSILMLSLPEADANWEYKVDLGAGNFIAKARRKSDDPRTWCMEPQSPEAYTCNWE